MKKDSYGLFDIWRNRKSDKESRQEQEQTLSALFNEESMNTDSFVHLAIDVQNEFCIHRYNDIAQKIGEDIAPSFNEHGIPTYWVYYRHWQERYKDEKDCVIGPDRAYGGMHSSVKPAANDMFIGKNRDSAFLGSHIEDILKENGKTNLIVTGFNYHACVYDTVMDAHAQGHKIVLLEDATNHSGTESYYHKVMKNHGIIEAPSGDILSRLARRNKYSPSF